jgi:dipeptidyl aminopeptidase/acylaminoacyl peptidase
VEFKHKVKFRRRPTWHGSSEITARAVHGLLLLCLATSPVLAKTPKTLPAKVFFRNPKRSAYAISPDGKKLAFLEPWQGHLNLFVRPVSKKSERRITTPQIGNLFKPAQEAPLFGRPARVTAERNRDIPAYFWKTNRYILFLREIKQGSEAYHLYRADVEARGSNVEDLTPSTVGSVQMIDRLEGVSASDVLITLNRSDTSSISDPYRLNVITGKFERLVDNSYGIQTWLADHAGRIRAGIAQNGVEASLLTRPDDRAEFGTVLKTNFRENISPIGYTYDNKYLYAISNMGRDKAALVKLDPATGCELEIIYQRPDVDVWSAHLSERQKCLTDVVFGTTKPEREFFDTATKKLYQRLEREFPSHLIWLTSHDEAEERWVVEVANDRTPGTRYLFDRRTDRLLEKLTEIAPLFNPENAAFMEPIEYPSGDGWMIHGYLTVPNGRAKTALPVVVLPHGGPWTRDSWGYDPEVQFLSNRGYAVLQINFRGSTGYGRRFWEAGFKEWGGKMQDDITAGVHWLTNRGIADAKRIAIYGESYGGYAALAGITFTPDLYKAAVDRAGPCDLLNLVKDLPGRWNWLVQELYIKVGDPETDREMLAARSPLFHVDQIRVPVFIAHGTNDQRVKINQSQQMICALKERGGTVEYFRSEREGHVFQDEEARIAFHERMAAFLEQYLR